MFKHRKSILSIFLLKLKEYFSLFIAPYSKVKIQNLSKKLRDLTLFKNIKNVKQIPFTNYRKTDDIKESQTKDRFH